MDRNTYYFICLLYGLEMIIPSILNYNPTILSMLVNLSPSLEYASAFSNIRLKAQNCWIEIVDFRTRWSLDFHLVVQNCEVNLMLTGEYFLYHVYPIKLMSNWQKSPAFPFRQLKLVTTLRNNKMICKNEFISNSWKLQNMYVKVSLWIRDF